MTDNDIFSAVVDDELDACGLFCPEPVMMLHNKMRQLATGATLRIIATDPSTQRDIPKFCTFLNHTLLAQQVVGDRYYYLVQKSYLVQKNAN